MNTIVLHGAMVKKFGPEFRLDVATPREVFLALCSQLDGFEAYVRKSAFRIVREKSGLKLGLDEKTIDLQGDNCTIHIYPAMVGAKSGLGKVLLGVAIIGLAIVAAPGAIAAIGAGGASFGAAMGAGIGFMGITYGGIAAFGAMLAFGGAAMIFAPSPRAQKTTNGTKNDNSFIINGPVNTPYQGVCVPLIYGLWLAGSVTVSSELTVAQLLSAGGVVTGGGGTGTGSGGTYDGSVNPYFPDYPAATAGVGGTGTGGTRTLRDIGAVNLL